MFSFSEPVVVASLAFQESKESDSEIMKSFNSRSHALLARTSVSAFF